MTVQDLLGHEPDDRLVGVDGAPAEGVQPEQEA
jgi:hypothetical protein